jgi:integrase
MALDDPQDFNGGLVNARRRLAESAAVHDADRPVIKQWMQMKDGRVAVSSLKTYLRRVRVASERSERPLVELDEAAYHDLIFSLRHDHDLADATVQSYENALLPFLEDMIDAEWAEDVDRTTVESGGPDVDEMLTPGDIQDLTTAARTQRDVAFIEFLADTGARLSLALSLRVKDVSLEKTATYTPNPNATGLKGAAITEYPLIDAVAALRGYLRGAHPRGSNPDVALFHKLKPYSRASEDDRWGDDDGGLRANAARQQLVRIADRAGVDKPVNPHAFRHAAITRMVREGYSRSQIEHRVHWTLDTDMWEIYEHVTTEEHNDDIFRQAGVVDDETGPDRVRKPCGQCRTPIAPHHEYCPQCGSAVTAAADDEVETHRDAILDDVVDATNPAMRRELRQVLDDLEEREDLAHNESS